MFRLTQSRFRPLVRFTFADGKDSKAPATKEQPKKAVSKKSPSSGLLSVSSYKITDKYDEAHFKALYKTSDISQYAKMEYKTYETPYEDPSSSQYVKSDEIDYIRKCQIEGHNNLVEQIKRDLKLQAHVNQKLSELDRPYFRGLRGNQQNVYDKLADYSYDNGSVFKDHQQKAELTFTNGENQRRFIDHTNYVPDYYEMSNQVQWKEELRNRPVNTHPHPNKGSRYEVEPDPNNKLPYVADRLACHKFHINPLERLFMLENHYYHPYFKNQPFVEGPNNYPSETLNLEEGEVLYENRRLKEYATFFGWSIYTFSFFYFCYIPYQLLLKTHIVQPDVVSMISWQYYDQSFYNWDIFKLHVPIGIGYLYAIISLWPRALNKIASKYVIKAQYNKDKELLFVEHTTATGETEFKTYELHHLEILPPYYSIRAKHKSSVMKDGIWEVSNMVGNQDFSILSFYKNKKYWNRSLYNDFINRITTLYSKDYCGYNRKEADKVRQINTVNLNE